MIRVILIGLSGTGKSTVAQSLARLLDVPLVDIDDEIVTRFGAPIPDIFKRLGEPVFRAIERSCLVEACSAADCVIATGGGIVTSEQNWVTMRPDSLIVHLRANPEEIYRRLVGQAAANPDLVRPLVSSADPRQSIERLWRDREIFYNRADLSIDTTDSSPEHVAEQIAVAIRDVECGGIPLPIASIGVPTGRSDLYVAPGVLARTGELVRRRFPDATRAWIVTDENVGPLWSGPVHDSLSKVDLGIEVLTVPAGEASKSLEYVSTLLDALLTRRLDRRDLVVALGGGVVGDLAGFVASIALRGVGLVQIPTSLLAMVDSSVGGKTGVNHERGKNLIGSFYQPPLVLTDPNVLETLPEREWRGGWAEIIKHGMIELTATGSNAPHLLNAIESAGDEELRDPTFMAEIVRRNVLIKSTVVQADERETGLRRILNYGHTLGHAMEASGYRYHHGEAIALGMRAAVDMAVRTGRSTQAIAARQNELIERIGLPATFNGELRDVVDRLSSDKKAVRGRLTWILPGYEAGSVDVVSGIRMEHVEAAALALGARP